MKKFLISVLALIMGVTLAFGLVACGDNENPDEGGNGEVTMTDAEIAEQAMSLLKSLYSATADNDSHYDVLGQVKVNETYYKVDWTVSSETENIENYVSIGQMDETSKLVRISLTMGDEAVEFKLKATVTVGEASASAEFAHKLNAKPADAKGTADDPYSTRKVIEIANGLQGTPPVYYYSEADQGAATPTLVWVEGYLVEWGNETTFTGGGRVNFVYIVENYTDESTRDSADALCIASIDYDDEHLTCLDDLAEGKHIVVKGYIELYQGGTTTTPKPELAYYKEANGTYHNVYCEELEKEQRTPQQNVELALGKVEDTLIFNQTGDLDLPASTIQGVTFTWSTTDPTYTIANNKLHIGVLPATDATVTATVTATYGTETVANNTKNVTITIKAAVTAEEGTAVFDFSGVSEKGVALSDGDATDYFKSFANADSNLTKAEVSKINKGNGQGGAHAESAGFLKAGTASAAGQIKLTFSKNVTSVVVNCHDWFAKSANYPTNSNTVAVNGSTQPMPYNETGTPGDLTFTLSEETNVVTIDINQRGFVFKITVTFGEGTVEPGPGGDTEETVFTPITTPAAGSDYYMSMKIADGKEHYITGSLSSDSYYLTTTTDLASAAKVTLQADGEGWLIIVGGKYLELTISGTHANPVFKDAQASGEHWEWDSTYNIFTWTDSANSKWFLGTRNDKTYDTIGGCAYTTYAAQNYKAYLGTMEKASDKTDQDKVNEVLASLNVTPSTFSMIGADADLPTSNSYAAEVVWTVKDHTELVKIEGNTLTVTALPNETTTVTLHVVVTLNGAKAEKDVTITCNPADPFKPITEPKEGIYYFATIASDGKYHYITGVMDSYYYGTTTDHAASATVQLIPDDSGWLLKTSKNKYIEVELNESHTNAVYKDERTTGKNWTWDDEKNIFYWTEGSTKYFLGTYNTYTTISASDYSKVDSNYLAVLGNYGDEVLTPPSEAQSIAIYDAAGNDLAGKTIELPKKATDKAFHGMMIYPTILPLTAPQEWTHVESNTKLAVVPSGKAFNVYTNPNTAKVGDETTITITATGGDAELSATVTFKTVEDADQEYVSSFHGYSVDDPLTTDELTALCDKIGQGRTLSLDSYCYYYLEGVVTRIENPEGEETRSTNTKIYFENSKGKEIYVKFGMTLTEVKKEFPDFTRDTLKVGDTLIVSTQWALNSDGVYADQITTGTRVYKYKPAGGVTPGTTYEMTATYDPTVRGYEQGKEMDGVTDKVKDVSVKYAQNSSLTMPVFYTTEVRVYYGSTFTVSVPEGYKITAITLTYTQTNTVTANVGTLSEKAWTGSETSVVFTVGTNSSGETKGHIRLTKIEVTYTSPVAACTHASLTKVPGTPAECEKDGVADYWTCDECHRWFTKDNAPTDADEIFVPVVLEALGHDYKEWKDNEDGATHTSTCDRCKTEQSTEPHDTLDDGKCSKCGGTLTAKMKDVSIELTLDTLGLTTVSYADNNKDHTMGDFEFTTNQTMSSGGVIQMQKGAGKGMICNKTGFPGRIKSIVIVFDSSMSSGTLKLDIGNTNAYGKSASITMSGTQTFTADEDTDYRFFKIYDPSATCKITSITINYETLDVSGAPAPAEVALLPGKQS